MKLCSFTISWKMKTLTAKNNIVIIGRDYYNVPYFILKRNIRNDNCNWTKFVGIFQFNSEAIYNILVVFYQGHKFVLKEYYFIQI